MIEFYGPISWCDSWQWLRKRGGKNTTTQHWLGELYSEQRNEFRISLNQASIIIAINTIRKYVPFFDMTAFIKCKNQRKCKHTHTHKHKHKHKQSKRIEFSVQHLLDGGPFSCIVLDDESTNESIKAIIESSWCQHLPHETVSIRRMQTEIYRCNRLPLNQANHY